MMHVLRNQCTSAMIPQELVSYIGTFLPLQDRRRCIDAHPLLSTICYTYKYHELVLSDINYRQKLPHLIQTLKYILKIKPVLDLIVIKFKGIEEYEPLVDLSHIFDILPIDKVEIHLNMCSHTTYNVILDSLPADAKIVMKNCTYYVPPLESNFIKYDGFVNDDNVHILRQRNIAQCRTLRIVPHCKNQTVDLSQIDVDKNKELEITVTCNLTVTDIWKVTAYNELTHTIAANTLYQLLADPNFHKARLMIIAIVYNHSIVRNDLFTVITALPKTVSYYLSPTSPEIFAFIDKLKAIGVVDIRYICDYDEVLLSALMCRKFPEYNYPLMFSMGMVADDNTLNMPLDNIYDRMFPGLKQRWHIVYKMLSNRA